MFVLGVDPGLRFPGFVLAEVHAKRPWTTFRIVDWHVPYTTRRQLKVFNPTEVTDRTREHFAWCRASWAKNVGDQQSPCVGIEWPFYGRDSFIGYAYQLLVLFRIWVKDEQHIRICHPKRTRDWFYREYAVKKLGWNPKAKNSGPSKVQGVELIEQLYLENAKRLDWPIPKDWWGLRAQAASVEAVSDAAIVAIHTATERSWHHRNMLPEELRKKNLKLKLKED